MIDMKKNEYALTALILDPLKRTPKFTTDDVQKYEMELRLFIGKTIQEFMSPRVASMKQAEAARSQKKYQNDIAKRKEKSARCRALAAKLKVGDFIKVSGARDGHGIRQVIDIGAGLKCRQVRITTRFPSKEPEYSFSGVTEHMLDKVVAILQPRISWPSGKPTGFSVKERY